MRVLAHLSDIHFGAVDPGLVDAVRDHLTTLSPDITVISGDLTQRARDEQFREARAFLDTLPGEKIVVPGNHDVPLWNLPARFLTPLRGYRRHITRDFVPKFQDREVAVVGLNTARSWTHKNGRVNLRQVDHACQWLQKIDGAVIKIIVTHHPFDLAESFGSRFLVGRARRALQRLTAAGAGVLLAGHYHQAYSGGTAHRYHFGGYSALVVQAGTATSMRLRGTPNSFNVLRIDPPRVGVEMLTWDSAAERFVVQEAKMYAYQPGAGFSQQAVSS